MVTKFVQLCILPCLVSLLVVLPTQIASAGIYDADAEVTYKEYWIPHSEFTGGFSHVTGSDGIPVAKAGCPDLSSGGSWYLEPWPRQDVNGDACNKVLEFTIPDNISQASHAEVYLDLWRSRDGHVYFYFNEGETRRAQVGYSWSRSPYVGEIPLTDLKQGQNELTFLGAGAGYHIHDIAVRVYFDDSHPLYDEDGAKVVAPQGELLSIAGDNGSKSPSQGGELTVNSDKLTLKARTTSATTFVEFHALYEGYDVDTDKVLRDWQNRGRNNWHPGGTNPQQKGGTVDHIGTVMTSRGPGDYTVNWQLEHVLNQAEVLFKTRLVREVVESNGRKNYLVTEAAGGQSAPFKLIRNRAVMAFMIDDFRDTVLCHKNKVVDGQKVCKYDEEITYNLYIAVEPDNFQDAYFLGSYWRRPFVSINDNAQTEVFDPAQDDWQLGIKSMPVSHFRRQLNPIKYIYAGPNFGQFIEYPGPMVVLAQSASSSDNRTPTAELTVPATMEGAPGDTGIEVTLSEMVEQLGHGVDRSTIKFWVNNQEVTPAIDGFSNLYRVGYQPPTPFSPGQAVEVGIEACDLAGNCLDRTNFTFDIESVDEVFTALSDDFNACVLNENVTGAPWTWNGSQDTDHQMTGSHFAITVPASTGVDVGPHLLQPVNDDPIFEIQMKFNSALEQDGQAQGALIMADANNYLRIYFERTGEEAALVADKITAGATANVWRRVLTPSSGQGPFYLRIHRNGTDWEMAYSFEGIDGSWFTNADYTLVHDLTVTQVGLLAANGSDNGDFTALVDYFFNMDAPISPQNVRVLNYADLQPSVTIDPLSDPAVGTVSGEPQNPTLGNPTCGTPLMLTATSAPGWKFDRWRILGGTGVSESVDNPLTRDFTHGESVTVLFETHTFSLDVAINHDGDGIGGTVSKSPSKTLYTYNEPVTLTAQSETGWVFSGWSGDLPAGADPAITPLTLTMDEDKSITATFTQNQYDLSVNINGSGAGAVMVKIDDVLAASPPATYQVAHGKQVSMQAFVAPDGSRFGGWRGDLPAGSDPLNETLEVTVTQNLSISASFIWGVALTTTVSPEGSGQIEIDPPKDEYDHDEEVTLEAMPNQNWRFVTWQGNLPLGADPTNSKLTVIMDEDRSILARFEQIFLIHLPIISR